jgi:hypothetical protein
VRGKIGLPARLEGLAGDWSGHVIDARPAAVSKADVPAGRYPPPDVALIRVEPSSSSACALLADRPAGLRAHVLVRGYTASLGQNSVTAESGTFKFDGLLKTPDPACTLFKLRAGQAVPA